MTANNAATTKVDTPENLPDDLKAEFSSGQFNGCVGTTLLEENERVRVWEVRLAPGERLPFHRHVLDYFWTAMTDSKGLSHYHDGQVAHPVYKAGDTAYMKFAEGEFMVHDISNESDGDFIFMTVEFLDSANKPIDVPDTVRRAQGI